MSDSSRRRLWLALLLVFVSVPASLGQINVFWVNDQTNNVAKQAVNTAINYIKRNPSLGVTIGQMSSITNNGSDAYISVENMCNALDKDINAGNAPHIILDTTRGGLSSEVVKSLALTLAIPTASSSYGQEGDIREWRNLDPEQEKYLVQISPPGDILPMAIRDIVIMQNITNAGILYDDSFVMDHKYKSLLQNLPTRHIMNMIEPTDAGLKKQLSRLRDVDIANFFILSKLSNQERVLNEANSLKLYGRKYAWYALSKEPGDVSCSCDNNTIVFLHPQPSPESGSVLSQLESTYGLQSNPAVDSAFYFDFTVKALRAVKEMMDGGQYPADMKYVTCAAYDENDPPERKNLNLRDSMKNVNQPPAYGKIKMMGNGNSYMEFDAAISKYMILNGQRADRKSIGTWKAGIPGQITFNPGQTLSDFLATTVYRVVTVVQPPFVLKEVDENGKEYFTGYCIDLINEIKLLMKFEYEIYEAPDGTYGVMNEDMHWSGMIKELVDKNADIALGALSVMAERENVVDFTVPYYDLVGITIMMKKPKVPTSLFKFLSVLENDVWGCILGAYFFTSILLWIFDRWSPYSYQNNVEKYKDDEEKRVFNLKECLWFCMTSLTPQGGGEAPKNLSGRLVAATWWLFGFIIIASYTANLAAFLTVSRLETPIESLEDLSKQYKIQYAPVNGSATMTYFERMAYIENKFYEIWKDMSLNDSLSDLERAKLAVWDYPVSDRYTKMWQSMQEAGLPPTFEKALERVRASKTSSEGFAFLGDATDIRYQTITNCDLQMVGDEFSRKPYAVAVQQGSPLKDQFNDAILKLLNQRKLETLKERWWNQNPLRKKCEKDDSQSDGISIHNIGGVFIVIFVGIGLACITLAFEYWYYKFKKPPQVGDSTTKLQVKEYPDDKASFQKTNFSTEYKTDQGLSIAPVGNPW